MSEEWSLKSLFTDTNIFQIHFLGGKVMYGHLNVFVLTQQCKIHEINNYKNKNLHLKIGCLRLLHNTVYALQGNNIYYTD